jgi:hypothetical protein
MNRITRPLVRVTAGALVAAFASATTFAFQGAAAAPAALAPSERKAIDLVRTATIRDVTEALAAPAMEGRGTASPGGDRAAQSIAERLE